MYILPIFLYINMILSNYYCLFLILNLILHVVVDYAINFDKNYQHLNQREYHTYIENVLLL